MTELGVTPSIHAHPVIQAIMTETLNNLETVKDATDDMAGAVIITGVQRIACYQLSGSSAVADYATLLGYGNIALQLKQFLLDKQAAVAIFAIWHKNMLAS